MLRSDEEAPIPRRVDLVLSCDGTHGVFQGPAPIETFKEGGYIVNRRAATQAGWTVTALGRVFCPKCKGQARMIETAEPQLRLPV
jgi:hypothetical protein